MANELKLVKKLAEVMQEVKYIQKRGLNKFHNYTYATESDVAEKIREELAKRFVMMIPSVVSTETREHQNRKGQVEYITKVRMEFRFMDGETGEVISFFSEGEGQDAGDKGVYKGITGAQKYALMKSFMIPTGDDPEADSGVDERNHSEAPKQQEAPKTMSEKQFGLLKIKVKELQKKHNISEDEGIVMLFGKPATWDKIQLLTGTQASTYIKKASELVAG